MKRQFLKIGHRGHGAGYGENTSLSIHLGLLTGADGVEYDVRITKDEQIVLMHDKEIIRTTDGTGKVSDYTYEELRQFNAGYRDCVPLLENVFRLFGYCFHNIELKENVGKEVAQLVMKYGIQDRVLVSTFNWDDLFPFAGTEIPTALLADADKVHELREKGFILTALTRGAKAVNPHFSTVTASLVKLAHEAGLKVYPWTVDEPDDIARMKECGVDGIISNYPERL
jgi:glycerophosphoryl diester phosphodiesterase